MVLVAQSRLFPPSTAVEAALSLASRAGFTCVELAIGSAAGLSPHDSAERCEELTRNASAAGVSIAALRAPPAWGLDLVGSSPAANREATDALVAALQRARWLRAGLLILPMGDAPEQTISHQDAANRLLDALLQLRFAAQRWAVTIACALPGGPLPMSPPETRDLMDLANSPWVRVCLDFAAESRRGQPQDWIDTLGHRLAAIDFDVDEMPATAGDGDCLQRIRSALQRIRFDGAMLIGGSIDLSAAHQRAAAVLRGLSD